MPTKKRTRDERTAQRREDIRERIRASNLLTAIENTENIVEEIARGPKITPNAAPEDLAREVTVWKETASIRIQAAKVLQDSRYKRLAKVVPDLKSIDMNLGGEVDFNHLHDLSDEALRRIAAGQ